MFEKGDRVYHKLTLDRVLILEVVEKEVPSIITKGYLIRTSDYREVFVRCHELMKERPLA